MTVYVDDMKAPYRGMIMCHMIADTEEELHLMADAIGLDRKHYQGDHYDICQRKKIAAMLRGAKEISLRTCGAMVMRRRYCGILGSPDEAVEWCRKFTRDSANASKRREKYKPPRRAK